MECGDAATPRCRWQLLRLEFTGPDPFRGCLWVAQWTVQDIKVSSMRICKGPFHRCHHDHHWILSDVFELKIEKRKIDLMGANGHWSSQHWPFTIHHWPLTINYRPPKIIASSLFIDNGVINGLLQAGSGRNGGRGQTAKMPSLTRSQWTPGFLEQHT